jgi:NADH:ubiquinone oxidoreductase subunit 5 (subunit L)/multisubunit Na+/H+ antiporter MnhA subunit
MEKLLWMSQAVPILGLLLTLLPSNRRETLIYHFACWPLVVYLTGAVGMTVVWLAGGGGAVFQHLFTFFQTGDASFRLELYFDKLTAVYSVVSGLLGVLTISFSRYYMHREPGYKRFFNNLLFFFSGLNLVICAGNFETMFMGWEIIGISSFLLIGFYRERYLPVKNAIKVVSLFRLSDVMLMLALWLSHLVFHENIRFTAMQEADVLEVFRSAGPYTFLIPACFFVVAAVKSAVFPFSSWLPRAMEGPTTSSAIFYGSLSVHIGIFLLLRISPFWEDNLIFRVAMAVIGLLTAMVASATAKVQSSAKTQIAYASVGQIGIMLIEAAMGWYDLVLVHFAGNATLRTYQLLVSPSLLHYFLHHQFYHGDIAEDRSLPAWRRVLHHTLLTLSIKEWNMDRFHYRSLWMPFKWLGRHFQFLVRRPANSWVLALVWVGGLSVGIAGRASGWKSDLGVLYELLGLILALVAFSARNQVRAPWLFLLASHGMILVSLVFHYHFDLLETTLYLGGIGIAWFAGDRILARMSRLEGIGDLRSFQGHIYEHPRYGLAFLLCSLALSGFPITPSFIGLDVVLAHIHEGQVVHLLLTLLSFIFIEIAALRIYARVFLGQHQKAYHQIAFRNS